MRDLYCQRGVAAMTASFDRSHLRKHGIRGSIDIVAQPVAVPHDRACALALAGGLERVDLIQIDAEGYDWPIIRSIDFARLRPRILRFEYRHMSHATRMRASPCWRTAGYRFIVDAENIIAHLRGTRFT